MSRLFYGLLICWIQKEKIKQINLLYENKKYYNINLNTLLFFFELDDIIFFALSQSCFRIDELSR